MKEANISKDDCFQEIKQLIYEKFISQFLSSTRKIKVDF